MYVFCGGMYRSCSTWQYEIAGHLVERYRQGRRLGYRTGPEFAVHDRELSVQRKNGSPTEPSSWEVLKSHEEDPAIAKVLAEQRGKVIYAYRDVRDVVFSMLHKRGVSFETFLQQGMIHQILANDRFWTTRPQVLQQRYDDLVADPQNGIREIAKFLDIPITDDVVEQLAKDYSREANLERTARLREQLQAQGIDLHDPANRLRHDEKTLLHWNHVRENAPTWRELATPKQRTVLGRICGDWLVAHGMEPDHAWYQADALPQRRKTWSMHQAQLEVELGKAHIASAWLSWTYRHPRTAQFIRNALGRSRS